MTKAEFAGICAMYGWQMAGTLPSRGGLVIRIEHERGVEVDVPVGLLRNATDQQVYRFVKFASLPAGPPLCWGDYRSRMLSLAELAEERLGDSGLARHLEQIATAVLPEENGIEVPPQESVELDMYERGVYSALLRHAAGTDGARRTPPPGLPC